MSPGTNSISTLADRKEEAETEKRTCPRPHSQQAVGPHPEPTKPKATFWGSFGGFPGQWQPLVGKTCDITVSAPHHLVFLSFLDTQLNHVSEALPTWASEFWPVECARSDVHHFL